MQQWYVQRPPALPQALSTGIGTCHVTASHAKSTPMATAAGAAGAPA
jgi:hypothetical protein